MKNFIACMILSTQLLTFAAHAEDLKASMGEVAVLNEIPELKAAPVTIYDDAAKRMFDNMVDVPADEEGIKQGLNLRCLKFQDTKYVCTFNMNSKGKLGTVKQVGH